MFAASNLRITYLKILERRQGAGYQCEKWVRKLCKSGDFLVRT
jgi:AP-2 complex subunit mu-1